MTRTMRIVSVAATTVLAGCSVTWIRSAAGGERLVSRRLVEQIAFEHRCGADRIVLLRDQQQTEPSAYDLDVCGRVRRYECLHGACADMTHAFPPDALPPPVQPAAGR